jgi:hypothetical protein
LAGHDAARRVLIDSRNGGALACGTAMAAFKGILTPDEVLHIYQYLTVKQ